MRRTYSITDFGAAGDGVTMDTGAIQKAVDAARASGGGEAVMPAGTYLSGGILLRSRVTLRLPTGAALPGSRDPVDYCHRRAMCVIPPEGFTDEPRKRTVCAPRSGRISAKPAAAGTTPLSGRTGRMTSP